jgi:3'(2'),5'-bisphosphate nucleotidase
MQLTSEQLAALCGIARAAGREIMEVYAQDFTSWKKGDSSPLTAADLRSDHVIREGIAREFPGVYYLSEESAGLLPKGGARTFFLVDPLDGTKEFLARNGEFTVNIALIDAGEAVAGVVYLPAQDEMFWGMRGEGAWRQRAGEAPQRLQVAERAAGRPLRVMGSRSHASDGFGQWLQALGHPYEFVAAGSSLKFCRIAEGAADLYPRIGPTSQWDTAAAQAVLEAAGGVVRDAEGQVLRYGLDRAMRNPNFIALADAALEYPPIC